MATSDSLKIFNEIVKIGSRIVDETNAVQASKQSAAISVLSSAMTLVNTDPGRAKRLTVLANNIAKSKGE